MEETRELDFYKESLTQLTYEAQNKLSCLLNTTKILLSDGPDKLPRDWRGLARIIEISSEEANSYESDKTAKVFKYWVERKRESATIGNLLDYVQRIDRYDIFDDLMSLADERNLIFNQPLRKPPCNIISTPIGNQLVPYVESPEENIITFDDKIHGEPQFYHAYVMYAGKDRDFVDEMIFRMRARGYKMCTEEDLLPDHNPYGPIARLVSSDRCHRIVLVYSPDFLESPANNFYMGYATAVNIEMKKPKIVPCMYRPCQLPPQMTFYHKLYYNTPGLKSSYNFWDRLAMSLEVRDPNSSSRLNAITSGSYSQCEITEYTSSTMPLAQNMLALPCPPMSTSMNSLDSYALSDNLSTYSKDLKKKQPNRLKNMLNSLKFRPKKKEIKLHA